MKRCVDVYFVKWCGCVLCEEVVDVSSKVKRCVDVYLVKVCGCVLSEEVWMCT